MFLYFLYEIHARGTVSKKKASCPSMQRLWTTLVGLAILGRPNSLSKMKNEQYDWACIRTKKDMTKLEQYIDTFSLVKIYTVVTLSVFEKKFVLDRDTVYKAQF